jgi:hypothetical protein
MVPMDRMSPALRSMRTIAMIALAYLFILQGLLSPFVAIAAPARLDPALAVLCLDGAEAPSVDHGAPSSHHAGDVCCDSGCLPHAGSGVAPAVKAESVVLERRLAAHSSAPARPGSWTPVRRASPQGAQGPRAPPQSVA